MFFFSQRHHEEGLRHIYQIYDPHNRGITEDGFQEILERCGLFLPEDKLKKFFLKASQDRKYINFQDFCRVMMRD